LPPFHIKPAELPVTANDRLQLVDQPVNVPMATQMGPIRIENGHPAALAGNMQPVSIPTVTSIMPMGIANGHSLASSVLSSSVSNQSLGSKDTGPIEKSRSPIESTSSKEMTEDKSLKKKGAFWNFFNMILIVKYFF
jgi:hypothetical protein